MDEKISIYETWKKEAEERARKFYTDPFSGNVEAENAISYFHAFSVGASSNAAIMGLSPWATAQDVYDRMIDLKFADARFVFERGHWFESFVAAQFRRITKINCDVGTTVWSKERPWSHAQIDYMCDDGTPVEIKVSTMNFTDSKGNPSWGGGCVFNSQGALLHEDTLIPVYYMVQCQKQMALTGKSEMWIAVWLTFEDKIRIFKVYEDKELQQKIFESEEDFLFNHVIPKVPYENAQKLEQADASTDGVFADEEFINDLRTLKDISAKKTQLEKQQKELTEKIKERMDGHHAALDGSGVSICTLTPQSRMTFDSKALGEKYPEIYSEFYVSKVIAPRLTISKKFM